VPPLRARGTPPPLRFMRTLPFILSVPPMLPMIAYVATGLASHGASPPLPFFSSIPLNTFRPLFKRRNIPVPLHTRFRLAPVSAARSSSVIHHRTVSRLADTGAPFCNFHPISLGAALGAAGLAYARPCRPLLSQVTLLALNLIRFSFFPPSSVAPRSRDHAFRPVFRLPVAFTLRVRRCSMSFIAPYASPTDTVLNCLLNLPCPPLSSVPW